MIARDGPPEFCFKCSTHRAVRQYCEKVFAALARKAALRLQRVRASGIYGDDHGHRTLWDEYCHEVQEGPHEPLEYAWETLVPPILTEIVSRIPHHEQVVLTIGAAWELDKDGIESVEDVVPSSDFIRQCLEKALRRIAINRDLSRFDANLG